jgi:hypothetical protein
MQRPLQHNVDACLRLGLLSPVWLLSPMLSNEISQNDSLVQVPAEQLVGQMQLDFRSPKKP